MTKLERYAHVAEIVSGVAIVITIIVLIFEVRINSALLERQIDLDRIDRLASTNLYWMTARWPESDGRMLNLV